MAADDGLEIALAGQAGAAAPNGEDAKERCQALKRLSGYVDPGISGRSPQAIGGRRRHPRLGVVRPDDRSSALLPAYPGAAACSR